MPLVALSFPVSDWQFWVVTLLALFALWYLSRSILPPGFGGKRRGKSTKTTLTIGGQSMTKTPGKK
jgi:hypothetical protein